VFETCRAFAGPETQRMERFEELLAGMRSGEALQQERRIERQMVELAQAPDQPHKVRGRQFLADVLTSFDA
jgi:hypothetical protein